MNVDDVFLGPEKAVISAVKSNLILLLETKHAFWNGVTTDCVVAGGYFANAFVDESYKDIDVFILNKNVSVYAHLTDNLRNDDQWVIRDSNAGGYLQNPHIHGTATNVKTKVQYILTDYATRQELLKDFDFRHATVSYDPTERKLYITRGAYDDIRNKVLTKNGKKPVQRWREKKFFDRGWSYPVTVAPYTGSLSQVEEALKDGYDQIVKKALGEMLYNLGVTKTPEQVDDTDLESFRKLMKE